MTAVQAQNGISPVQAQDLMTWVVEQTRRAFDQTLRAEKGGTGAGYDHETSTLEGMCGFSQSFIILTLNDYGFGKGKPFAIQSMRDYTHNHVGVVVEMETSEGTKHYLLDPTFRQFEQDNKKEGAILANMPEGEYISQSLREAGFIELTPQRAESYLAAFNRGIPPFDSAQQAMDFMKTPPEHDHNNWFSRKQLKNLGVNNI